jgi:hypothetical protein
MRICLEPSRCIGKRYLVFLILVGFALFSYGGGGGDGGGDGTNRPPVAMDMSISTAEDKSQHFVLQATDPEGDCLIYSVVTNSANGTSTWKRNRYR